MARNAKKTNALGLDLDPESFKKELAKEEQGGAADLEQEPVVADEVTEPAAEPEQAPEPSEPVEVAEPSEEDEVDPLEGLESEKKKQAYYTYYMSKDIGEKVKKLAKKKGVGAGKVVEHILRQHLK